MSKLRKSLPTRRRQKRTIVFDRSVFEEGPKQSQMLYDFGNIGRTEIIVRHEFEMCLNLLRKIGRQLSRHGRFQGFALNLCLLVIRFYVGEILRGGVKKLPDQRFLPIRPALAARPLTIGQGQKHQRVQIFLTTNNIRKLGNRGRVIEISLLRGFGEGDVVIDQKNEGFPLLGRKLKTLGHTLREKSARFGMRSRADGPAGVMQKQGEVKNERMLQIIEKIAIRD